MSNLVDLSIYDATNYNIGLKFRVMYVFSTILIFELKKFSLQLHKITNNSTSVGRLYV